RGVLSSRRVRDGARRACGEVRNARHRCGARAYAEGISGRGGGRDGGRGGGCQFHIGSAFQRRSQRRLERSVIGGQGRFLSGRIEQLHLRNVPRFGRANLFDVG